MMLNNAAHADSAGVVSTSGMARPVYAAVLMGSYVSVLVVSLVLLFGLSLNHSGAIRPLVACGAMFASFAAVQWLVRAGRHRAAAYLLVLAYVLIGAGIVWVWGVVAPTALLVFALTTTLAGVLLGDQYALCVAAIAAVVLAIVQATISFGWHMPALSASSKPSGFADIVPSCAALVLLALVVRLYIRETQRLLNQVVQENTALQHKQAVLELQARKRSMQLRKTQLEEIRQIYRFATLGQAGVTLLHDLANHLMVLAHEVDGIQNKQHTKAIERVRNVIHYLERMVGSTRERLRGGTQKQTFDVARITGEVLTLLQYKAAKAGVAIDWSQPAGSWKYTGDPACYCQVVTIIVSNAIDAYGTARGKTIEAGERKAMVAVELVGTNVVLRIRDNGGGLAKAQRRNLFKPYHSTKKTGLGLGLYIAKQTVETQFSGTLTLNSHSASGAEFVVTLPLPKKGTLLYYAHKDGYQRIRESSLAHSPA